MAGGLDLPVRSDSGMLVTVAREALRESIRFGWGMAATDR